VSWEVGMAPDDEGDGVGDAGFEVGGALGRRIRSHTSRRTDSISSLAP
jgi:hypothetical protein